jgi:protein TonB
LKLKLKSVAFCVWVLSMPGLAPKQDPSKLDAGKTSPVAEARQPHRIRVNEDVQKAKLVHLVSAVYPPVNGKRVDGTVILHVIVGQNGAVNSARYVSGPLNLKDSAVKAVLQWRYEPTLLNGAPVEVDTTVSVVFPPPGKQGPRIANK